MPYKDYALHRAACARYYARNREKVLLRTHAYKQRNLPKIKEQSRLRRLEPGRKAEEKAARNKYRDKRNAWRRKDRKEHPEKYRASHQRYIQTRREKLRAQKRARYWANPEKYRKEAREYASRHPEQKRVQYLRWYLANPVAQILRHALRRARLASLPCTFTLADHEFMMTYFTHACATCGAQEGFWNTLAADHWHAITAPSPGGTTADNMIPLCQGRFGCNNSKNNKEPVQWLQDRFGPRKATAILKRINAYFAIVRARQADHTAS